MKKVGALLIILAICLTPVLAETHSSYCYHNGNPGGTSLNFVLNNMWYCGRPNPPTYVWWGEEYIIPGYIEIEAAVGPAAGASIRGHSEGVATDWVEDISDLSDLCSRNAGAGCNVLPSAGFYPMGTCHSSGVCYSCSGKQLTVKYDNSKWNSADSKFSSTYCGASADCNARSPGDSKGCGNFVDITCSTGSETCLTSCTSSSQCDSGYVCRSGDCQTNSAPSVPVANEIENSTSLTVTLSWQASTDIDSVTYEISYGTGTPDNTAEETGVSGTSKVITFSSYGTYKWWVRACDAYGACSAWSNIDEFTINEPNSRPTVPVLTDEPDAHTTSFELDWSDSTDPEGDDVTYDIRVGTTDGSSDAHSDTGLTESRDEVVNLLWNTLYYWSARACDTVGCSAWAPSDWFTPTNLAPPVPVLTPEADLHNTTATLEWSAAIDPESDGVSYDLRVGTSENGTDFAQVSGMDNGTLYSIGGLGFGSYWWGVRACDAYDACSLWSGADSFDVYNIEPPAPALVAEPDTHDTEVTLEWADAIDPDGDGVTYDIRVGTSENGTDIADVSGIDNGTAYLVSGLDMFNTYWWNVRACDAWSCGEWSGSDSFETVNTAPPAPVLVAEADSHQLTVELEWADAIDPDGDGVTYDIRVGTSENGTDVAQVSGMDNTTLEVSGLTYYSTYYWNVRACDAWSCGEWSGSDSFETVNDAPPMPVLVAEPDSHDFEATLQWSDVTGGDGEDDEGHAVTYDLIVGTSVNASDIANLTGLAVTSRLVQSLQFGTYWWSVRACDEYSECSDWAASDSFEVYNTVPPVPVLVDEPNTHELSVTLEWADAIDPDGDGVTYDLRVGTTENGTDIADDSSIDNNTYPISGLGFGNTYYWNVRACDAWSCSEWSGEDEFSVGNDAPETPVLVDEADTHDTTVLLQWNAASDPNGDDVDYDLRVGTTPNGTDIADVSALEVLEYSVVELDMFDTYYWNVRACDEHDDCSEWSGEDDFTIINQAPPEPVNDPIADTHEQNVTLSWAGAMDPDGDNVTYSVRVGTSENGTDVADAQDLTETQFQLESLPFGSYWWNVRACDDWSCGEWSGSDSFDVYNTAPPVPALVDEADTHDTTVTLEWGSVVDPDSDNVTYDVRVGTSANATDIADVSGISGTEHQLGPLGLDTYYWNVRACDAWSCSEWSGEDDFIVTNSRPSTPLPAPEADTHDTEVTLEWSAASDPDNDTLTYDLRVGTSENGTDFAQVSGIDNGTAYLVGGLDMFNTYWWNVRACDAWSCGEWSGSDSFETVNTAPPAPVLTPEPNTHDTEVTLEWADAIDPDGDGVTYNLRVGTSENGTDVAQVSGMDNGTAYALGDLTWDTVYHWSVQACDSWECSQWATEDTFMVGNDAPVTPVLVPEQDTHDTNLTLEWLNTTDPDGDAFTFDLRVGTTENASDVANENGLAVLSHYLEGLTFDQDFFWNVRACDAWDCSEWSGEDEFRVGNDAPPAPVLTPVSDSHQQDFLLQWSNVTDADGDDVTFEIRVGTSDNSSDVDVASGLDELSYLTTGLTPDQYYWSARACDDHTCGDWATSDVFTMTNGLPPAPALVAEPDTHDTEVTLEWADAIDPDGDNVTYSVRVGTSVNGSEFANFTGISTLNQTVSSLVPQTTYWWSARACDQYTCGDWAENNNFTITNNLPPAPALVAEPDTHDTEVTLEWADAIDPDGDGVTYDIRVGTSENGTDFAQVSGIDNGTAYLVSGLDMFNTYWWNVRACDAWECGEWSGSDSFETINTAPPAPVLVAEPDSHERDISLDWGPVSDGDGDNVTYDVRVGTSDNASDILYDSGLSVVQSNLSSLDYDTYYWSVRACDAWECGNWPTSDVFEIYNTAPNVGNSTFNTSSFEYGQTIECLANASDGDGDTLTGIYNITGPAGENYAGAAACDGMECSSGPLSLTGLKGEWNCVISASDMAETVQGGMGTAELVNTPPAVWGVDAQTPPFRINDPVTVTAQHSEDINPEDTLSAEYRAWDSSSSFESPLFQGEMLCDSGECSAGFTLIGLKGEWNVTVLMSDGEDQVHNSTIIEMLNTLPTAEFSALPAVTAGLQLQGSGDDANTEDTITGYSWEMSSNGTFMEVSTANPYAWDPNATLDICPEDTVCTVRFNAQSSDGNAASVERNTTVDISAPVFSNPEKPENVTGDEDIELSVNLTESHPDTVLIQTDHNGTQNYSASQDGDRYYVTIAAGTLEDGQTVRWHAWANDTAGNANVSAQDTFTVIDDEYPIISGVSPESGVELPFGTSNVTVTLETHENATCRWDGESGVAYENMTGTFNETGGTNHSVQFFGLMQGQDNRFYVRCSDSWSEPNISPELELNYPVDDSDHSAPVEGAHWTAPSFVEAGNEVTIYFNWTDNIEIGSVIISHNATSWDNFTANVSGNTYSVTIPADTLVNGQIVGYYSTAVDTSENENTAQSDTYMLMVHNDVPDAPSLVVEPDVYETSTRLEWSAVSDAESDPIHYEARVGTSENGTEHGFWSPLTNNSVLVSNMDYGKTYHWSARACDPFGCSAWAPSESFSVIDTVSPVLLQFFRNAGSTVNEGDTVDISSEWSDNDALSEHALEHNLSGYWFNESWQNFSSSWANHSIDTTGLGGKQIAWRVWAKDESGNLQVSGTDSVFVQVRDLAVSGIEVSPGEPFTGDSVEISAEVSNQGTSTENATIRLFVNGTEANTTTLELGSGNLTEIAFNWTPVSLGTANITVSADLLTGETDILDNSATEFVGVSSHVDDLWVILLSPDKVQPDSNFTSKLYIYNLVSDAIDSIQAALSSPDGITVNTPSPMAIGTIAGQGMNKTMWDATAPSALGDYTLDANVSQTGLQGENHDAENVTVENPHSPLLSVDVAAPPIFFSGQEYEVVAQVYNYGNETAFNTWANITLPAELTLKGGEIANRMVGNVVNGTTEEVNWTVLALQTGSFSVQVNVSSEDGSSDDDNSAIPTETAELVMNATAPTKVARGTSFEVDAVIQNNGDGNATGVWVNLTLPGELSCTTPQKTVDVPAGESRTVTFTVDANTAAASAGYKVIASFSGPAVYYKESNRQIEVKIDNKAPDYSSVSGPATVTQGNSATVSSDWSDEFLGNVTLQHNATGNWTSQTLSSPYSYTISSGYLNTAGKRVQWFFSANDTSGNTNSTENNTIVVVAPPQDTRPPRSSSGDSTPVSLPQEEDEEETGPECGDGVCNGNEDCKSCPEDCGECPAPEPEPKPEAALTIATFGPRVVATVTNDGDGVLRAALTIYADGEIVRVRKIEVAPKEKSSYTFDLELSRGEHEIVVAVAGKQAGELVTVTGDEELPKATMNYEQGEAVIDISIPRDASGLLMLTLYQDGKEVSQQTMELSAGTQSVSLDNLMPGIYQANVKLLSEDGTVLYEDNVEMEMPVTERSLSESVTLNSTLAAIWLLIMALGLLRVLEA